MSVNHVNVMPLAAKEVVIQYLVYVNAILDMPVRNVIPVPLVIVAVMASAAQLGILAIAKDVGIHIATMVTVLVTQVTHFGASLVDFNFFF